MAIFIILAFIDYESIYKLKEQIASQCRDINSHNYKGKFPKGMMAVNENSHGKKKAETPKVYGN